MRNYPHLWIANISRLLEKRAYSIFSILAFSLFVGSFRLFAEWALGGFYASRLLTSWLILCGFYWLSFFVFATVLRLLVDQPWRTSINVILVGIFLGVFPPIIDALVGGTGFHYSYIWNFPATWKWGIYNPAHLIPIGEAAVLWAVVVLTVVYVRLKTRSLTRTVGAGVLAYGAVIVLAAGPATIAEHVRASYGWPYDLRTILHSLLQFVTVFLLYLVLQPNLLRVIGRCFTRALLLLAVFVAGTVLVGEVSISTFLHGALLAVMLLGVVVARQASSSGEADRNDAWFLTINSAFLLAVLAAAHSSVFLPLLLIQAGSLAVGRSPARAVPEPVQHGLLAAGVFLVGAVAAAEYAAFEAPRWWISYLPRPLDTAPLRGFDGGSLALMVVLSVAYAWFVGRPGARRRAGDGREKTVGKGRVPS